ncbi:hypothetical protein SH139x_004833 [Planctomycetaceae bacterium SH139]
MAHIYLFGAFRLFSTLVLVVAVGSSASAQFDFGNFESLPADPNAGQMSSLDSLANPQPAADAETVTVDEPLITELRRLAGGTADQVGLALREAIRNQLWSEVNLYLTSQQFGRIPAEELSRVANRVGGRLLSRAAGEPSLTEAARTNLDRLSEALLAAAQDPTALSAAIRDLGSEDSDRQLGAGRVLLRGGPVAMKMMIEAAVSPEPPAPLSRLAQLLRSFDAAAVDATFQLALYGTDKLRPGALKLLYGLDAEAALTAYLGAVGASAGTAEERRIAVAGLQKLIGGVPSSEQIEAQLAQRLERATELYQLTKHGDLPVPVWRIAEERQSIAEAWTSQVAATAVRAADLAELLRRQGELRTVNLAAAIGADLRHQYLRDFDFGDADDATRLEQKWGAPIKDLGLLSGILTSSLGDNLAAGTKRLDEARAIGVIRLLGQLEKAAVVQGRGAAVAPLVAAVSHSVPRIRYEAAAAISQLQPTAAYAGSGRVLDRWIEMSHLPDAPRAIMLVNDVTFAKMLSERLLNLGYELEQVYRVRDLLEVVDSGGDLQLVVAATRPPDYSAIELVDRVRRRPLGGTVPIVLVGDAPAGFERLTARWSAPTILIPQPADVFLPGDAGNPFTLANLATVRVAGSLADLQDQPQLPPLSAGERQLFAAAGRSSLAHLADTEALSSVYNWQSREADLLEAVRREGYGPSGLKVLSAIGSSISQAELATLAANPAVAEATRRAAAEAFAASIDRSGTRLSRQQVQEQYDRFNGATDLLAREIIGQLLDALESRVGVSSRPSD